MLSLLRAALVLLALLTFSGCGRESDVDREIRPAWIGAETEKRQVYLRRFLNGTDEVDFFDGWYPLEHDPKTGGAWRWMERRSITRLRTKVGGATAATDMRITVHGWTPYGDVGVRTLHMEFAVNGHVLERFEPPNEAFVHTIFVPKWLLERSERVDFAITVANTARPKGDWRDIGFATTGIVWKPAADG